MNPESELERLAAEVARAIGAMTDEYLGIAVERTRVDIHDDVILAIVTGTLSGSEHRLAEMGGASGSTQVRAMRRRDDTTYETPLAGLVEQATGIGVRAVLTDTDVAAATSAHVFLLEHPIEGAPVAATFTLDGPPS